MSQNKPGEPHISVSGSSTCPPRKTRAWKRVISPAAIGLVLVLATLLSISLSHMSLIVHPAPRMTIAPTANFAIMRKSGRAPAGAAMAMLQQHGHRSNHVPTGLSARTRYLHPTDSGGESDECTARRTHNLGRGQRNKDGGAGTGSGIRGSIQVRGDPSWHLVNPCRREGRRLLVLMLLPPPSAVHRSPVCISSRSRRHSSPPYHQVWHPSIRRNATWIPPPPPTPSC